MFLWIILTPNLEEILLMKIILKHPLRKVENSIFFWPFLKHFWKILLWVRDYKPILLWAYF
jgi:hypothetical protein